MRGRIWGRALAAVAISLTLVAAPVAAEGDSFADYTAAYVQAVGYAAEHGWFAKGLTRSQLFQASLDAIAERLGSPAPQLSGDPRRDRETAVAFLRDTLVKFDEARDRDELFRAALKGILKPWDRWTYALTPFDKIFNYEANGYFDEGDGVILRSVPDGDVYVVDEVIPGTSGARAGIKAGDVITAISGIPVSRLTANDALIYRLEKEARQNGRVIYSIRRGETIVSVEVDYGRRKEPVVKAKILQGNVGYIWFPGFIAGVGYEFEEALAALGAKGLAGLVVDLRGNEGGSSWEAQIILSQFLKSQLFGFRSRKNGTQIFSGVVEQPLDIPIAIVLDRNSASASEVVAFVLRDRPKTRLFGVNITMTYGKGVGQSSWLLSNDWLYACTTLEIVLPSGESYHGKGVRVHETISAKDVAKGKEPPLGDQPIIRAVDWLRDQ